MKLLLFLAILPLMLIPAFAESDYTFFESHIKSNIDEVPPHEVFEEVTLFNMRITEQSDGHATKNIVNVNDPIYVKFMTYSNSFTGTFEMIFNVISDNGYNERWVSASNIYVNNLSDWGMSNIEITNNGTYTINMFLTNQGPKHLISNPQTLTFTTGVDNITVTQYNYTKPNYISPHLNITYQVNGTVFEQGQIIQIVGTVPNIDDTVHPTVIGYYDSLRMFNVSEIKDDWTYELLFDTSEMDVRERTSLSVGFDDKIQYIYFDIIEPPPPLTIQTDKPYYNEIETMSIIGTLNFEVDPLDNASITLYDENDNVFIPATNVTILNGESFSHSIITDTVEWGNYTGDIKIVAQIQEYTGETIIQYSLYPATLSMESLYDMIHGNTEMINSMYAENSDINEQNAEHDIQVESSIESLDENIISLEGDFDGLQEQLDETHTDLGIIYDELEQLQDILSEQLQDIQNQINELQVILDIPEGDIDFQGEPPVIDIIHVTDVDKNGKYSSGDTITINFDSNTNTPGESIISKSEISELFTFSEKIGRSYNGVWTLPDTFIITVDDVRGAELIIDHTTVTPTRDVPILSYDEISEPSYMTSPTLKDFRTE